jgi:L-lactate dehydrogenase complex protein LldG
VAESLPAQRVVRSGQPVFDSLPLDAALTGLGVSVTTVAQGGGRTRESLRQEIIGADLGITGADYAVAETGSVIVLPRQGLSRLVSVVPPVHLALVRPVDIVETLTDLFLLRRLEYHRNGGDMGSYLNFITGPSRTADIEMTIVVGVHGPKQVHLVLLES